MKNLLSIIFTLFSVFGFISTKAQSYWLNTSTGQIEILSLIITPLGTDAQYKNSYSIPDYKPVTIKGDPMKVKKAPAILPTNENVTITFPTEKEDAKITYSNGQTKVFKNAALYINKKGNDVCYFAVQTYFQADQIKHRVFYKSWSSKTEEELVLLSSEDEENGLSRYKFIMPDNTFTTLQEYSDKETFLTNAYLIDTDGKKTFFTKEH